MINNSYDIKKFFNRLITLMLLIMAAILFVGLIFSRASADDSGFQNDIMEGKVPDSGEYQIDDKLLRGIYGMGSGETGGIPVAVILWDENGGNGRGADLTGSNRSSAGDQNLSITFNGKQ